MKTLVISLLCLMPTILFAQPACDTNSLIELNSPFQTWGHALTNRDRFNNEVSRRSWIDYKLPIPPGVLRSFKFYFHNDFQGVFNVKLQIWSGLSPNGYEFKLEFEYEAKVTKPANNIAVINEVAAFNFTIPQNARIGWTLLDDKEAISYSFCDNYNLLFRQIRDGQDPTTGKSYEFAGFPFPGMYSIGVELDTRIYSGNGSPGRPGATGPKGDKGAQGVRGEAGTRGNAGEQGERGPRGDTGSAGPAGSKGSKGDTGSPGSEGADGATGLPGSTGQAGPEGPAGPPGATGPRGSIGSNGLNGIDGDKGERGAKGNSGVKGDKGDPGSIGGTGLTGLKGDRGDSGSKGERGARGPTGPLGPIGPPGTGGGTNDVNECERNTHTCVAPAKCSNTVGSYVCQCEDGYSLSSDGKSCRNRNECDTNNGGCEHICSDNEGSYKCSCRGGYSLSDNSHSCHDINECTGTNNLCASGGCINTPGSYTCVNVQLKKDPLVSVDGKSAPQTVSIPTVYTAWTSILTVVLFIVIAISCKRWRLDYCRRSKESSNEMDNLDNISIPSIGPSISSLKL